MRDSVSTSGPAYTVGATLLIVIVHVSVDDRPVESVTLRVASP